ncbi:ribosome maturation factor RimP [Granulosicoccaceae sp. 1_MG-2023]|nr:ribosome maturation factor RimP [Granulosicoccaceae sp. 1_MG-2023]
MQRATDKIWNCVEPVVTGLGYDFVGAEYGQAEGGTTLRVYIDKEGGVLLDDCATVSQQLSAVLDVEEPIQTQYSLEVSSPGVDRPLFRPADFARFEGQEIRLRSYQAIMGRRNFRGPIKAVEEERVLLEVDGEVYEIPFSAVEQARLIPAF